MDEIGRRIVLRPLIQLADRKARRQCRDASLGESADNSGGGGKARGVVGREGKPQLPHQPLERQIARPARHRVIAEIYQTARFEAPIDELAKGALALRIDPGIDAMSNDVVELRQFEIQRRSKIDGVKKGIEIAASAASRWAWSMCTGMASMPWNVPVEWVAARMAAVTSWPQPRSHLEKPPDRRGGSPPAPGAAWSSHAGASIGLKSRR